MTMDGTAVVPGTTHGAEWVDDVLLAGPADDICFRLPDPIDREKLRRLVRNRQSELARSGLRPGGAAALRLPPSMAFVTHLLAVWRSGGHGVEAAVVVFDGAITAYLQLSQPRTASQLETDLSQLLAPYKRPRTLHLLDQLPRTTTGKLVRDLTALRKAAS